MLQKISDWVNEISFMEIIKGIPLGYVAATIGLFFAALIISKLIKRHLRKAFGKKRKSSASSFWVKFWETDGEFFLKSIGWVVWLVFIGIAIYIWSAHIGKLFSRLEDLYAPIVRSIVIVIMMTIALKSSRLLIKMGVDRATPLAVSKTTRGKQRMDTLSHIFRYGVTVIIILITSLMLLGTFGIDLKAVLATVGVASLAIGFGAQSLVKDIVSGIFILMEDQMAVGDVAVINGEGGVIERMTLRVTQLRNTHGMLITIPNGEINMVKNLTSEWSRVDYTIGVAYDTNLDHAMDVLMEEAIKLKADMPKEIIEEPERIGVDEFGDSSITLRVWIKTKPLMQWKVKREYNRRVHRRFDREGIEIPFPQRTLWIKEPKEALLAAMAEVEGGAHVSKKLTELIRPEAVYSENEEAANWLQENRMRRRRKRQGEFEGDEDDDAGTSEDGENGNVNGNSGK